MGNELINILRTVNETTGIDCVAYSTGGALLYRTPNCPAVDFSFPRNTKEIIQPENERITVLPLTGAIVVLAGDGEAYKNYAALIRTAAEKNATEPKKEKTLTERLRLYLLGEADDEEAAQLQEKYAGMFDSYVLTVVTDSAAKRNELIDFLETMRERGDLIVPYDPHAVVFIKQGGGEDEYQSATDFAYTLYDSIKEELRINIVINVGGTVHSFQDVAAYFNRCRLAYRFGQLLAPNERVYSYKEFILVKMLSDIPAESLKKYLDTLSDRDSAEILGDNELMFTAREFLKNSLNISETSRSMYMHRNTLIYRLDKIEKATGLNLRHFNDAVAFHLLTVLNELVNGKTDKKK